MSPMNNRLLRPLAARFESLRVGLVAYWPLNETATSGDVTAEDWTNRGNDLTSNNSVLSTAGKVNNAREFVAANSEFLGVASSADVQFGNGDWSLSLWVQPRATGSVNRCVIGKDASGAREFVLFCETSTSTNTNRFSAAIFNTSGGVSANPIEPADTSNENFVNAWFHLVVINAGGVMTLYRNGVSRASATRPVGQVFAATAADFNIGRRPFGSFTDHFDGYVDEVAKWTRALSATEITRLYNNGNGIDIRQ